MLAFGKISDKKRLVYGVSLKL